MKPASPSFYTAKPAYTDSLILLDDLARRTKRALEQKAIPIRLPAAQHDVNEARRSIAWQRVEDMSKQLQIPLRSGQYRHIVARLSVLARYRYFVQEYFSSGAYGEQNRVLAQEVERTLQRFNRKASLQGSGRDEHHAGFLSSSSGVDELGRAYARGRRKESSARVWLVPAQNVEPIGTNSSTQSAEPLSTVSTSVLINTQALSAYFTRVSDRERIVFPLRATGLAGTFNIFALVTGGGTTGQSGAIAHGIARALITFFDSKARKVEDVEGISSPAALPLREQADNIRELLARTGASLRDTRTVERKKTGKAKARKSYTWVKR
jgi:small subunit ribosomal protein S9